MPKKYSEPTSKELLETGKRILDAEVTHGTLSPAGRAYADAKLREQAERVRKEYINRKKKNPDSVPTRQSPPFVRKMRSGDV